MPRRSGGVGIIGSGSGSGSGPRAASASAIARSTAAAAARRSPWGRATARGRAGAAGAALGALEDAEAARLADERPPPPDWPRVVQLSLDGAMAPLVGGEWAEVKLAAVGEVVASRDAAGDPVVRAV